MVRSVDSSAGTDRLDREAQLGRFAEAVFDSSEKARRWMATPNVILGAAPVDLLGSDDGGKRVEEELMRIDHGGFA